MTLHDYAQQLLRDSLQDETAAFRDGQWKAIETLVEDRAKLLVVQRTGWGKSSVYFITTKLLRERGGGPTILISPLLALMRDQIRAAERLGLRAAKINSTNQDDWQAVADSVADGTIDILLISPERLANEDFCRDVLEPLLQATSLLVVDEAHCISDWGHDFRPDYRRIRRVLTRLSTGTAVLATTATANDMVVHDVAKQLGGNVTQIRGPLSRASLQLQAIHLRTEAQRLAWLAAHLPQISGSGIIYVLTRAHAARVAQFLTERGIDAESYTGSSRRGGPTDADKQQLEQRLLDNDIKAVVATPALGMGFDKPDLAFVIHFQMPQSLIHYYQQVGRAGRAVDTAVGVLLHGDGDRDITDYFINQAFPPAEKVEAIVRELRAAPKPMGTREVSVRSGVSYALTDKVLRQMSVDVDAPIKKLKTGWRATDQSVSVDVSHFDELTQRRRADQDRIAQYARQEQCMMQFIARELDDPYAEPCGRCAFCIGNPIVDTSVPDELLNEAKIFIETSRETSTKRRKKRGRRRSGTRTRKASAGSGRKKVRRNTALGYISQAARECPDNQAHARLQELRADIRASNDAWVEKTFVLEQIRTILND